MPPAAPHAAVVDAPAPLPLRLRAEVAEEHVTAIEAYRDGTAVAVCRREHDAWLCVKLHRGLVVYQTCVLHHLDDVLAWLAGNGATRLAAVCRVDLPLPLGQEGA